MKYCQGPLCHTYKTKDRIRGHKGDKHYETRKDSRGFYNGEFCSNMCRDDWFNMRNLSFLGVFLFKNFDSFIVSPNLLRNDILFYLDRSNVKKGDCLLIYFQVHDNHR